MRNSLEVSLFDRVLVGLSARFATLIATARLELANAPHLHVESCAWFAASYIALRDYEPDNALAHMHRLVDAYGADTTRYTHELLDQADDPFLRMVKESKLRETEYFGAAFTFEWPRDDDRAYHLHITGCCFHNLFVVWGVAELTAVFCRLDEAWIRGIEPERDGFTFNRPTTIGLGHDCCRFLFERLDNDCSSQDAKSEGWHPSLATGDSSGGVAPRRLLSADLERYPL